MGNHTGPRQLEFPEHARVGLRRQIPDRVIMTVHREGVRVVWCQRDTERMPWGPRNSFSSSILARMRRNRASSKSANSTGPVSLDLAPSARQGGHDCGMAIEELGGPLDQIRKLGPY